MRAERISVCFLEAPDSSEISALYTYIVQHSAVRNTTQDAYLQYVGSLTTVALYLYSTATALEVDYYCCYYSTYYY